ncbi:hypothetical protein ACFL03_00815 [Thermodesulfobacteriota bacterium]
MKQKYVILNNNAKKELVVKEYAELDKETFSLLCEHTYEQKEIKSAIAEGKEILISALRRDNMYPIGRFAEKMAEAVMDLIASQKDQSVELLFDDTDMLTKGRRASTVVKDDENESADIDELLEEDVSNAEYDDEVEMKKISSSIKVAEDESVDIDDEG